MSKNSNELREILTQLEEIGEELDSLELEETNSEVQYNISMCSSELVDAREYLRECLK